MAPYVLHDQPLEVAAVQMGPASCTRVQEYLLEPWPQFSAIPHAEMLELMPAKENLLKAKRGEHVINPGKPLGHTVVKRVFSAERQFLIEIPRYGHYRFGTVKKATVCRNLAQGGVSVGDETEREFSADGLAWRCLVG